MRIRKLFFELGRRLTAEVRVRALEREGEGRGQEVAAERGDDNRASQGEAREKTDPEGEGPIQGIAALEEELGRVRGLLEQREKELVAIKSTLGWRVLERYRRLAGSLGVLSFVHLVLMWPIRRWITQRGRTGLAEKKTRAGEGGADSAEGGASRAEESKPQSLKKLVAIRLADVEQTRRAVDYLRRSYPAHQISLVIPSGEEHHFAGLPGLSRTYAYDDGRLGPWRAALRLLEELRRERFDAVVVVGPQGMSGAKLNLSIAFSFLLKAEKRFVMGNDFELRLARRRSAIPTVIDLAAFAAALPLARLGTLVALFLARSWPERPEGRHRSDGLGAIALLVPILPDLSHTFVYREALQLLAEMPRKRRIVVVALEEGRNTPLHEEARRLLAHTVFVPGGSLSRYLALYLYYLLTRPRRVARLIGIFSAERANDPWLFVRLDIFHGLHPGRGLPLARLLEREGVTYIHCYGSSYPGTRALVASNLLDIPFSVSTFVDFDYPYAFKCLREKVAAAEFVVACTDFCRKRLVALTGARHEGKIHVIHHALDSRYGARAGEAPVEGAGSDSAGVFTACRFVEKKGLAYLIQACALLRRRGLAVRCLLIGEGAEGERLRALAGDLGVAGEVRFLGALPNEEIWRAVGPEDVCVVPSVYSEDGERDGIPVILMEALLRGHAVVSTPVSGIPELVVDGVHGLLVPERDAERLALAIEAVLEDRALRRRMAEAGRERVMKEFNIVDKARQLQALIEAGGHDGGTRAKGEADAAPTRSAPHLVSVILVNYNGLRFIEPLFESLRRQTYRPLEIRFFDNGSTDGSAEVVATRYPEVKVVQMDRNTGYSFPVNEGIRQSAGEYVLVLNVDVVLTERFVEEMVRALEDDPTVGWVAGKVLKLTESGISEEIDCLGHHMSRGRYATETDYSRPFRWSDYAQKRFVFGASACAAMYRRTMLEDVRLDGEYFDEDFFAYFEDVDLDWRAQQRGWKCVYTPYAVAYHMRGGSGLIRRPSIAACYLANRWLMLVKNDEVAHLLRDFAPFAYRLARDLWAYGRRNPGALPLAAARFARYVPGILRKRRSIKAHRAVPRAYLQALIR